MASLGLAKEAHEPRLPLFDRHARRLRLGGGRLGVRRIDAQLLEMRVAILSEQPEQLGAAEAAAEQGEVDFGLDKAIRVLGATRPVYLDADLLILQALTDAFFVLVRVPSTT